MAKKLFFSDDFIQAQQHLARWASEDVVSVVVMESDSSAVDPSPVAGASNVIQHITSSIIPQQIQQYQQQLPPMMTVPSTLMANNMNGLGAIASRTPDFYHPSPSSTTETESSGSVMVTQRRGLDESGHGPQEITGRYPEYKH